MRRTHLRAAAVAVVLGAVALAVGTSGPSAAPVVKSTDRVAADSARLERDRRRHRPRGDAGEVPDRGPDLHDVRPGRRLRRRLLDHRGKEHRLPQAQALDQGASTRAAAASAAYSTLVYFFPAQAATLTSKYTDYLNVTLSKIPAAAKQAGVAVGAAAAADLIASRWGDGRDAPIGTPYGAGTQPPGTWVFAPAPSAQSAQTPWVGFMKPFLLESASQFRAPTPPALTSRSTPPTTTR